MLNGKLERSGDIVSNTFHIALCQVVAIIVIAILEKLLKGNATTASGDLLSQLLARYGRSRLNGNVIVGFTSLDLLEYTGKCILILSKFDIPRLSIERRIDITCLERRCTGSKLRYVRIEEVLKNS